jgi:putative aldouronate transport system substrate-binding protein
MKRWIVIVAAALVLASLAWAQDKKPVDIELWALASATEAGPPPDDWAAYKIIRDKLGINLKLVFEPSSPSDQDMKISTSGASNSLPDVFAVTRDMLLKIAKQGLVAPVDSMLPMMPIRTKSHYSDPIRNALVTINGKMYGLPDPGALTRIEGVVIRKDWLDKLGLKVPKTVDEYLAVARAFTEKDPDGNGKADTYGFGMFPEYNVAFRDMGLGRRFDFLMGAYGVPGVFDFSSADKFGFNFRLPEFRQAIEFVKKLNDAKVIDPDWPILKKEEFRLRWAQGRYGIMWEQMGALHNKATYTAFDKLFPEGEWVPIAPPVGPAGKSSEGVEIIDARVYAVSAKAAKAGKAEAIARLLEWMASPEGYYLLAFGQEGVNYKKDAQGYVSIDGIPADQAWNSKAMTPFTQLRNLVYTNSDQELKARYFAWKSQNGRTIDPAATAAKFRAFPWLDTSGAALIVPPANSNDFKRYYEENLFKFVLGQAPITDQSWGEFLKGLDGLGAKAVEASAKATLTEAGLLR